MRLNCNCSSEAGGEHPNEREFGAACVAEESRTSATACSAGEGINKAVKHELETRATVFTTDMRDLSGSGKEVGAAASDFTVMERKIQAARSDVQPVECEFIVTRREMQTARRGLNVMKRKMKAVRSDLNVMQRTVKVVKCDLNVMQRTVKVARRESECQGCQSYVNFCQMKVSGCDCRGKGVTGRGFGEDRNRDKTGRHLSQTGCNSLQIEFSILAPRGTSSGERMKPGIKKMEGR